MRPPRNRLRELQAAIHGYGPAGPQGPPAAPFAPITGILGRQLTVLQQIHVSLRQVHATLQQQQIRPPGGAGGEVDERGKIAAALGLLGKGLMAIVGGIKALDSFASGLGKIGSPTMKATADIAYERYIASASGRKAALYEAHKAAFFERQQQGARAGELGPNLASTIPGLPGLLAAVAAYGPTHRGEKPEGFKMSYEGLPPARIVQSNEEIANLIQQAAVSRGPAERDLMQQQIANLQEITGTLLKIEANTAERKEWGGWK